MTDPHAITTESLLMALPDVLREDTVTLGLATAIAAELNEAVRSVSLVNIYANIDTMDEAMLDILAKDFKVDWWRADATIEEKRYTLKTSWYVHRHLGTPAAVRTAIADFIGAGKLEEWFEYGGKPHHFRIKDGDNTAIISNMSQFLAVLRVVQRGSSVLDHITALLTYVQNTFVGFALHVKKTAEIGCETADLTNYTILLDEDGDPLLMPDGGLIYL